MASFVPNHEDGPTHSPFLPQRWDDQETVVAIGQHQGDMVHYDFVEEIQAFKYRRLMRCNDEPQLVHIGRRRSDLPRMDVLTFVSDVYRGSAWKAFHQEHSQVQANVPWVRGHYLHDAYERLEEKTWAYVRACFPVEPPKGKQMHEWTIFRDRHTKNFAILPVEWFTRTHQVEATFWHPDHDQDNVPKHRYLLAPWECQRFLIEHGGHDIFGAFSDRHNDPWSSSMWFAYVNFEGRASHGWYDSDADSDSDEEEIKRNHLTFNHLLARFVRTRFGSTIDFSEEHDRMLVPRESNVDSTRASQAVALPASGRAR